MKPVLRALSILLVLSVTILGPVGAASAQIGDVVGQIPIPDLPPELEDPLTDIVDQVEDGVVGAIGDIPLDNAVQLLGDDGVEAAINLSKATFPDGMSPVAMISRSTIFPDSLSSGGAQGVLQAPLLVTAEDELDPRVVDELARLGVTQVVVLGNTSAISDAVVAQLEGLDLRVDRLGGPTRIETAVEVAAGLMPDASRAIIARAYPGDGGDDAQAYVDSLSVGPWAAEDRIPILLTQTDVLTPTLRTYLEGADITTVTIIGGEEAIAPAVATELEGLGITVERVAGVNRFATAVAVAAARGYLSVSDFDRLLLAEVDGRDDVWVPGFAAAANGGLYNGPILLTDGLILPTETIAYLVQGLPDTLADLGGAPVICTSFVNLLACEAAALLLLGALTEVQDLLGMTPLPVGDIIDIITGGDEEEGPPADEDPPADEEDPPADGEDPPAEEECLFPAPFPCVPPPGA